MSWSCAMCTFANTGARTVCEMCEAPRPPAAASASASVSASASASASASITAADDSAEQHVRNLQNLGGFSRDYVLHALALHNQSVADAASWLLMNPPPSTPAPASAAVPDATMTTTGEAMSAEMQERLRLAQAAEAQRLERERERDARRREDLVRELGARREDAAQQQAADARQRHRQRVHAAVQREQHERSERAHHVQLQQKRLEREAAIVDIPSAIRVLKRRYGVNTLKQTLALIAKIIGNIVEHPEQHKFRRLDSSTPMFRNRIRGRLGALAILRCLGFVAVPHPNDDDNDDDEKQLWVLQQPDLQRLADERAKMLALVNRAETKIPELLAQVDECADQIAGGEETILFLAMSLKSLLENALVAPNSTVARRIDTRSDAFVGFFEKVPQTPAMLHELGYTLTPPFWSASPTSVSTRFEKAVRDLTREIATRSDRSAVMLAVDALRVKNAKTPAKARSLVAFVIERLVRLVDDQHSTQHHCIRFSALFKRTGAIAGLKTLVHALGIDMVALDVALVPYPYSSAGIEAYRLRLQLLRRAAKRLASAAS